MYKMREFQQSTENLCLNLNNEGLSGSLLHKLTRVNILQRAKYDWMQYCSTEYSDDRNECHEMEEKVLHLVLVVEQIKE